MDTRTTRIIVGFFIVIYIIGLSSCFRLMSLESRVGTIENDYYGMSFDPDTVSEDGKDDPSWNYDSEITMPHQTRIYDMLMNIDGLTDSTIEQISKAWSNKTNNLRLSICTMFDEGSIIDVVLKLDDGTYLTASTQWHSNVGGWELTRWDRVTPEN